MLADIRPILIKLIVAFEAYLLASSSSFGRWKRFLNGVGDKAPVDEEGCP